MSQFKDQGGLATSDPSAFQRWATSRIMTHISTASRREKQHRKFEAARQKAGKPHEVEYFHQVDDGYGHLALQVLPALAKRYDITLTCHLVTGPTGKNSAEPELLAALSRYDSQCIAAGYGLTFPSVEANPEPEAVARAQRILAGLTGAEFIEHGREVSEALWSGDAASLADLESRLGSQDAAAKLEAGTARRNALNHYSGAMFYYGGEWYWGVDRLYHLEQRLAALGADRQPGEPPLVPRPQIETGPLKDNGSLTLEVYPSLRSPYTAMSFDRSVALARETGVTLELKPVLPMVMRGVPATRQKGMYIFMDAAREARAAGVDYGNFYDPIGEPARRAYSLYPWAVQQGRAVEFISAFLRAAFAEGVNTLREKGLRHVVEAAGLSWAEAQAHLGDTAWEAILESNRQDMYQSGLWGVPSFRLLNATGEPVMALWGQDRLWTISQAIQAELQRS